MSKKPLAILTLSVLTLGLLTSPARADLADVARGVSTANDVVNGISRATGSKPKASVPTAQAQPQQQAQQRPRPTAVDMVHKQVDGLFDLTNLAGRTLFP